MSDQHRHAIGRTRNDPVPRYPRDEPVALDVGARAGTITRRDLPHCRPVHLPLFEQAIACHLERSRKTCTVLRDCIFIVTKMKTEIERVVRGTTHTTGTRCETVTKTVSIQKGRMQSTHIVFYTTTTLRES